MSSALTGQLFSDVAVVLHIRQFISCYAVSFSLFVEAIVKTLILYLSCSDTILNNIRVKLSFSQLCPVVLLESFLFCCSTRSHLHSLYVNGSLHKVCFLPTMYMNEYMNIQHYCMYTLCIYEQERIK